METAPSVSAGLSPFSGPSGGPGFNTMTKDKHVKSAECLRDKHSEHKYSVDLRDETNKEGQLVCAFVSDPSASLI